VLVPRLEPKYAVVELNHTHKKVLVELEQVPHDHHSSVVEAWSMGLGPAAMLKKLTKK
jgi:hypothetical protein